MVTSKSKEEWDVEALFDTEEKNFTLTVITSKKIDYENDWIVYHMPGGKDKLQNLSKYKGSWIMVTMNNSKPPIAHTSDAVVSPQCSSEVSI